MLVYFPSFLKVFAVCESLDLEIIKVEGNVAVREKNFLFPKKAQNAKSVALGKKEEEINKSA